MSTPPPLACRARGLTLPRTVQVMWQPASLSSVDGRRFANWRASWRALIFGPEVWVGGWVADDHEVLAVGGSGQVQCE